VLKKPKAAAKLHLLAAGRFFLFEVVTATTSSKKTPFAQNFQFLVTLQVFQTRSYAN
jgi:hypothetical protein